MAMTARMASSAQIEFGRIDPHHICRAMRGSRLSQPVAQHVHGEHGERKQQPREEQDPRRDLCHAWFPGFKLR
jgi:hypothetical protein